MITVTLDTNVLVDYWRHQKIVLFTESLLDLGQQGKIEMAITSRIGADIPDLPLTTRINDLPQLNVQRIGAVFRLGHLSLDGGDSLESTRQRACHE